MSEVDLQKLLNIINLMRKLLLPLPEVHEVLTWAETYGPSGSLGPDVPRKLLDDLETAYHRYPVLGIRKLKVFLSVLPAKPKDRGQVQLLVDQIRRDLDRQAKAKLSLFKLPEAREGIAAD